MSTARRLRGLSLLGLAACSLLALANCAAQPIATFARPEIQAEAAQAQHDLIFEPALPTLAPGELQRLHRFLRPLALAPQDDVRVRLGMSGSDLLDRDRLATLRAAFAPSHARLIISRTAGFSDPESRPEVAFVQAMRVKQVIVHCQNSGRTQEALAYLTELPPIGCANSINLAAMTALPRDLSAPRRLVGADATAAAAAVRRYRAGPLNAVSAVNGTADQDNGN